MRGGGEEGGEEGREDGGRDTVKKSSSPGSFFLHSARVLSDTL